MGAGLGEGLREGLRAGLGEGLGTGFEPPSTRACAHTVRKSHPPPPDLVSEGGWLKSLWPQPACCRDPCAAAAGVGTSDGNNELNYVQALDSRLREA